MNKKTRKAVLFALGSSLSVGTIIGISLSASYINNSINSEVNPSLNLETSEKANKTVFNDTVLTKAAITSMGWDQKATITLADWVRQAPNVTQIGENNNAPNGGPFSSNTSLTSIQIPAKITSINRSAFEGATNLATLSFENNSQLREIGVSAFQRTKLTEFRIPNGVTTLRSNIFSGTPITRLIVNDQLNVVQTPFKDMNHLTHISIPLKYRESTHAAYWGLTQEQFDDNVQWRPVNIFEGTILTKEAMTNLGWNKSRRITRKDWADFAPNVTTLSPERSSSDSGAYKAAFSWLPDLEYIELPDTIRVINFGTFYQSTNLRTVDISQNSNLEILGGFSFRKTGIRTIFIPRNVRKIDEYAFDIASSLTEVTFHPNSQLNEIALGAFNSTAVNTMIIPDSVKVIGTAFSGVKSSASQISMPGRFKQNSTPKFGFNQAQWNNIKFRPEVFRGTTLTKENVIALGWDSWTRITLADWAKWAPNVTQIGDPNTNTGSGANQPFQGSGFIWKIEIPDRITAINFGAFSGAAQLTSIEFSENSQLKSIKPYAFKGTKLTNITIPANVTSIGDYAFDAVRSLTNVTFRPNSKLNEIAVGAFNSTAINTMSIPDSVKVIGTAFSGVNSSASQISMPGRFKENSTPKFGFSQAQWNNIKFRPEVFMGRVLTKATVIALGWDTRTRITLDDWTQWAPNVIEIGEPKTNVGAESKQPFKGNGFLWNIQIPDRITTINFGAFSDATQLTTVEFSENSQLKWIREYAFKGTKLTNITIPANVTAIDQFAYSNIKTLNQVRFANNSKTTTIGDSVFRQSSIRSINIPNSVTSIGISVFQDTSGTLLGQNVSMSRDLQQNSKYPLYGFDAIQWSNISWRQPAFRGNILTKQAVRDLGWDQVQSITLEDWRNLAPNVTILGENDTQGSDGSAAPFSFNTNLRSIAIPKGVTKINFSAFRSTTMLNTITFENASSLREIASYAFKSSSIKNLNIPNGVTSIAYAAFLESSITNITLPNSLTSLASEAFAAAINLTSINIPVGVTSLPRSVFRNTNGLQTVIFPTDSRLTTIGAEAFSFSGIRKIVIPRSVTSIQEFAFRKTGSLTDLTFQAGSGLLSIGNMAFQDTRATLLDIPNSVTNMHANALGLLDLVGRVSMSSSLRKASLDPLYGLSASQWKNVKWKVQPFTGTVLRKADAINLTWWDKPQITLADWNLAANVTHLGVDTPNGNINEAPFANNTTLTSIILPSKLTHIGYNAFSGATALKNVTFQDNANLTNIGKQAFSKSGIIAIDVPNSVTTIATDAFANTAALPGASISMLSKLRKSSTVSLYGFSDEQWRAIVWRVIKFEGTTLLKSDMIDLNWYSKTEITLEDWKRDAPNVTKISNFATSGDANTAAFYNNKTLTKIFIPAKITQINYGSFNAASNLAVITFEQNSQLDLIGDLSFKGAGLLEINIPEKTTSIGQSAFFNAAELKRVYIPDSVTTIGTNAFGEINNLQGSQVSMLSTLRGSSLNTRKFGFTQEQWNTISWRGIAFKGETLLKENVVALAWDQKTEITLEDWKRDAPNVTTISAFATSGNGATAAFSQLSNLQSIEIPAKVTTINFGSFYATSALQSIIFESGSSLTSIGDAAFRQSSLQSIEIPVWVTEIGRASFEGAVNLTSMTFQEGSKLTKIAPLALNEAISLTSLVLPDSIETIGLNALQKTTALKNIQLPYEETLFLINSSHTPLYGLTQEQWNSIQWTNVPTKGVKINSIIARSLLEENSVITWEELLPFTGIESRSFTETNVTGITLRWKEGFIVHNNAFLETAPLKDIEMSVEYQGGIEALGFSEEQLRVIKFINNSEAALSQNVLILAASLSALSLLVTVVGFTIIIKKTRNSNSKEKIGYVEYNDDEYYEEEWNDEL